MRRTLKTNSKRPPGGGAIVARRLPVEASNLPLFCDFDCAYASFAPPDAIGACRRDQAVYCKLFSTFNNKNARCLARKERR